VRRASLAALVFAFALWAQAVPQSAPKRRIPCKTTENASSCYWTHGRIAIGAGTPAYRLWKVGTKRMLGIYSGPSVYHGQLSIDNENPEFPANVEKIWDPRVYSPLYGDFEVCPLAPERAGFMRPACVESAKNLFVEPLR
jgi:hypothetical protein